METTAVANLEWYHGGRAEQVGLGWRTATEDFQCRDQHAVVSADESMRRDAGSTAEHAINMCQRYKDVPTFNTGCEN